MLAWQVSGEWAYDEDLLTEVEVRFIPLGLTCTRVALEHRGLDTYDDRADEMRGILDSPGGWPGILERFAAAVNSN